MAVPTDHDVVARLFLTKQSGLAIALRRAQNAYANVDTEKALEDLKYCLGSVEGDRCRISDIFAWPVRYQGVIQQFSGYL